MSLEVELGKAAAKAVTGDQNGWVEFLLIVLFFSFSVITMLIIRNMKLKQDLHENVFDNFKEVVQDEFGSIDKKCDKRFQELETAKEDIKSLEIKVTNIEAKQESQKESIDEMKDEVKSLSDLIKVEMLDMLRKISSK